MRKYIALNLFLVCKPLLACSLSQIDITRLARDFARFVDFKIEERSDNFHSFSYDNIRRLLDSRGDDSPYTQLAPTQPSMRYLPVR